MSSVLFKSSFLTLFSWTSRTILSASGFRIYLLIQSTCPKFVFWWNAMKIDWSLDKQDTWWFYPHMRHFIHRERVWICILLRNSLLISRWLIAISMYAKNSNWYGLKILFLLFGTLIKISLIKILNISIAFQISGCK